MTLYILKTPSPAKGLNDNKHHRLLFGKRINGKDMRFYSSLIPSTIYVCVTILILSVEAVSGAATLQSEAKVKLCLKLQSKTVHSNNQFRVKITQKQGAEV